MDHNALFQHLLSHTVGDLGARLAALHGVVQSRYSFVSRMAIALLESSSGAFCTFFSSDAELGMDARQLELDLNATAQEVIVSRRSRIRSDLQHLTARGPVLAHLGLHPSEYQSCYIYPICIEGSPIAFLYFEAKQAGAFVPAVIEFLDPLAQVVVDLFLLRTREARGLIGSVQLAVGLMQARDVETGNHLARMADYAAIIAEGVADDWRQDASFVDHVTLFAPLHDIGKVGIPDAILLKPGPLDSGEWTQMRNHVLIGKELTDRMISDLGVSGTTVATRARNIVLSHHERGDGTGYPHGLRMNDIPLEARIVAVADVYDTLASFRPYKTPRSEQECLAVLRDEADAGRLDKACVDALIRDEPRRMNIRMSLIDPVIPALAKA